jgi:hypothetical protein
VEKKYLVLQIIRNVQAVIKNWNINPAVTTAGPRIRDCDSEKKIKNPIF